VPYTTEAQIEDYLERDLNSHEVGMIVTAIPAVDHLVDTICGRTFENTTAATRYYDGNGKRELFINDFSSVTSIAYIDEDSVVTVTLEENEEYELYPLNADYKNSIVLRGGTWSKGIKNIKVVGNLGFTSIPEAIQMAATMIVANLIDSYAQNLKSRSIEGYSEVYTNILTENPQIQSLLSSYKKVLV